MDNKSTTQKVVSRTRSLFGDKFKRNSQGETQPVRSGREPSVTTVNNTLSEMKISDAPKDEASRKSSRSSGDKSQNQTISYSAECVVGSGSFGVVFKASVVETGDVVAIKKVLQDKRYKNRELQIMRQLKHPNVVELKHCFYSTGDKPDQIYLNLVLEYIPETVYRVSRNYSKLKQTIPVLYVKIYMYQLLRSLAYIHSHGICHRDIKPQNLLVDTSTHTLKLCDFGSAKVLVPEEPNISYICSRYYRAPELIFGATDYTTAIDIWSTGCVMAELLLGQPLFPGESGVDQLVEIIKVLGTPTKEQIQSMNQNYNDFKFPQIKAHPWHKVFRASTPPEATDLVSKLLQYNPRGRSKPLEACAHPFFDELRDPNARLPNGKPIPLHVQIASDEISKEYEHLRSILIPEHVAALQEEKKSN
eukprot:Rmarinus@m.25980